MKRKPYIDTVGDIFAWLDVTRDLHNGLGGEDFKVAIVNGVPNRRIALDFGVEEHTVGRWRKKLPSDILKK